MIFRARQFEYLFPRPALVMGVLNVTPDSFSDGGKYTEPQLALDRAHEMLREGAEIIDVGGESSRPGSQPVSEAEELRRVLPVVAALAGAKVFVSIDTMKPAVAKAALEAGAAIINDVGANRESDEMWRLAAETGAGYVTVHMQGNPQTMQENPVYSDVVREVGEYFDGRLQRLFNAGIAPQQVVLDPGIGFGKKLAHNLQLLAALGSFTRWERPVLLGVSRKSFIGSVAGSPQSERLSGALACTVLAASHGVQLFRTHDVSATVRALRMTEAILAGKQNGLDRC